MRRKPMATGGHNAFTLLDIQRKRRARTMLELQANQLGDNMASLRGQQLARARHAAV